MFFMQRDRFRRWQKIAALTVLLCSFFSSIAMASSDLRIKSHGKEVSALQEQLKRLNYTISSVDGIFGRETETAVLEFQRDQHLKITGSVDGQTWRALKKAKPIVRRPISKEPIDLKSVNVPESAPFLSQSRVPDLVAIAKKYIGTPYKFGTAGPKSFDCSGYLQFIFAKNNVSIPRTADEQYKLGQKSTRGQLVEGDLVFFSTYEPGPSHCGLYLGDGKFIHASSSKGIRIDELDNDYWKAHYLGGKHIVK
jgi:cell wall-associated NlpC family hydrolase